MPSKEIDNTQKRLLSFALFKSKVYVALLRGLHFGHFMAVGAQYSV